MLKKVLKAFCLLLILLPAVAIFSACGKKVEPSNIDEETKPLLTLEYTQVEYTGMEQTPAVSVKIKEEEVPSSKYEVAYEDNIEIGTAKVIVTSLDKSYFDGTLTATFEITKIVIAREEVSLSYDIVEYDGEEKTPEISIMHKGSVVSVEGNFTITYQNNINVGTASVTVEAAEDSIFVLNETFTFEIAPIYISYENVSLSETSFNYTGQEIKPRVIVMYGGKELKEGEDFRVTYYQNVQPGFGQVYVENIEGSVYSISVYLEFEIIGTADV